MLRCENSLTVLRGILHTAPSRPRLLPARPARVTVFSNWKSTPFGCFMVVPLVIPASQATGVVLTIPEYVYWRDN